MGEAWRRKEKDRKRGESFSLSKTKDGLIMSSERGKQITQEGKRKEGKAPVVIFTHKSHTRYGGGTSCILKPFLAPLSLPSLE